VSSFVLQDVSGLLHEDSHGYELVRRTSSRMIGDTDFSGMDSLRNDLNDVTYQPEDEEGSGKDDEDEEGDAEEGDAEEGDA
jgi:hypothetical protein